MSLSCVLNSSFPSSLFMDPLRSFSKMFGHLDGISASAARVAKRNAKTANGCMVWYNAGMFLCECNKYFFTSSLGFISGLSAWPCPAVNGCKGFVKSTRSDSLQVHSAVPPSLEGVAVLHSGVSGTERRDTEYLGTVVAKRSGWRFGIRSCAEYTEVSGNSRLSRYVVFILLV